MIRALLPPLAVVLRDAPPELRSLIARADRLDDAARGRSAAVTRAWSATPATPLPVAPALRDAECSDAADALWISADPGHARADLAALRLVRSGDLGLTHEEADVLVRELKPLFGDAGFELSAPTPDHWFLRGLVSDQRPEAPDPEDILGDDLEAHLPAGRDAPKWRRLLNETQIVLHNHPVNAARAARGEVTANTLWFWGGGRRPSLARTWRSVLAQDRVVCALAHAAGAALVSRETLARADEPVLVECWRPEAWTWLCETGHALLPRRIAGGDDALELECWSGERFRYRRVHRFRFWRAAK